MNEEMYLDLKEGIASIIFEMVDLRGEIIEPENVVALSEESVHTIGQAVLDLLEQENII